MSKAVGWERPARHFYDLESNKSGVLGYYYSAKHSSDRYLAYYATPAAVPEEMRVFDPRGHTVAHPLTEWLSMRPPILGVAMLREQYDTAQAAYRLLALARQSGVVEERLASLEASHRELVANQTSTRRELIRLRAELEQLTAEQTAAEPPPAPDLVSQWLALHPQDVEKYRGKRIAVHPVKGIVAHGDTLDEVYQSVAPDDLKYVYFDTVPA